MTQTKILRQTKVKIPETIAFTSISPDGKLALFEDLNHGGVSVIETATGKTLKQFDANYGTWPIDSLWMLRSNKLLLSNVIPDKDETHILFYDFKSQTEDVQAVRGIAAGARLLFSPTETRWATSATTLEMGNKEISDLAIFDINSKDAEPKIYLFGLYGSEVSWIDDKRLLVTQQGETTNGQAKTYILDCDTGQKTLLAFTFIGSGFRRDITPYPDTKGGFTVLSRGLTTDTVCYLDSDFSKLRTIQQLPAPAPGFSWSMIWINAQKIYFYYSTATGADICAFYPEKGILGPLHKLSISMPHADGSGNAWGVQNGFLVNVGVLN